MSDKTLGFIENHFAILNIKSSHYYNHRLEKDVHEITASCLIYTETVAMQILNTLSADYEMKKIECHYSYQGMTCKIHEEGRQSDEN